MEGIEISFPLSVCRDLMENQECHLWRFYQASISPGKTDRKKTLGGLRTRVISPPSSGTEPFVDLVLTFPRHTIKCPAVRGNLRCSAEILKKVDGADQSSVSVPRNAQLVNNENDIAVVDNVNVATAQNFQVKTKRFDKLKAFASEKKTDVDSVSDDTTESQGRPSRRREKPSKYKDYVATVDLPQNKEDQEKEEPNIENTNSPEDSANGNSGICNKVSNDKSKVKITSHTKSNERSERSPITMTPQTSPKQGKRIVRKYDKLIKNLQQASAKSGLEMQSVISGFRTDAKRTDGVGSSEMSQMNVDNNEVINNGNKASEQNHSRLKQFESGKKNGTKEQTSANSSVSFSCASEKKYLNKAKSQMGVTSSTSSYLTSFPRKFPSSLTRTDVLLTNTPVSNSQKRQSGSVTEDAGDVLSKYRKIQTMEKDMDANEVGCHGYDIADENDLPAYSTSDTEPHNKPNTSIQLQQQTSGHSGVASSHPTLDQSPGEESAGDTQDLTSTSIMHPSSTFPKGKKVLMAPTYGGDQQESGTLTASQSTPEAPRQHQKHSHRADKRISAKTPRALVPAMADHDYTDAVLGRKTLHSTKALRTLVRPISLSRHISARVERVVEGKGSSLVTISGLNSKAAGGKIRSQNFSLRLSPDGLPIADSLDDVMTDTFRRRKKHWESLRQAMSAPSSPQVCMKVDDMAVLNEVVLTHSGQLRSDRHSRPGRPRKYPPMGQSNLRMPATARQSPVTSTSSSSLSPLVRNESETISLKSGAQEDGTGIVIHVTQPGVAQVDSHENQANQHLKVGPPQGSVVEGGYPLSQDESFNLPPLSSHQSNVGTAVVEVVVEKEQPAKMEKETASEVVVENEEAVKNSQQPPAVKFCKYCLRLFPASIILLRHVKTAHASYAGNVEHMEYLDSLRRDSRITCPYCPGNHTLSNEYKLRSHLAHHHGSQLGFDFGEVASGAVSPQCEVCLVHFHALSELKAHATLVHNSDVYGCSLCPEVFVRDSSLAAHMKDVHSNPCAFTCKACDSGFDTRHLLQAHKQMVHGYQPKQYSCQHEETPTSGGNRKNIKVTQISATSKTVNTQDPGCYKPGLSRIKCPCCDTRFTHFWQQREHRQQIHSGPIPVHCPFCGLGYQSLTPMLTHLHQHLEGDVAVQVATPGSTSLSSALLQQCPFCSPAEAFGKASALVSHVMENHSDLFPFVCSTCRQRFISEEPLRIHLQQAHELIDVTVTTAPVKSSQQSVESASFQPAQNLVAAEVTAVEVSSSSSMSTDTTVSIANSVQSSVQFQQVQSLMPVTVSEVNSSSVLSSKLPFVPLQIEGGAGVETQNTLGAGVSYPDSSLPISEDLNSDMFFNLPVDAQQSIQLITQQGKRAILTISDGKGHVQKVSFIQGQTQSSLQVSHNSCPLPPPVSSPALLENLAYHMNSAARMEAASGAPSAISAGKVIIVDNHDFGAVTQIVPADNPNSEAAPETDIVPGTPGYETETVVLNMSGIPTDTDDSQGQCSGNKTEINEDLHNYAVLMEKDMEGGIAREMEIVTETLDGAVEIQADNDAPEVVTNFEVVTSDITASSGQEMDGASSAAGHSQEGQEPLSNVNTEGAVVLSELSAENVQSYEAETLSLSTEDILKLIKVSQATAGAKAT